MLKMLKISEVLIDAIALINTETYTKRLNIFYFSFYVNYSKTVKSTKAEGRSTAVQGMGWWLKGIGLLLKTLRCFKTDRDIMVVQPVCVLKPLAFLFAASGLFGIRFIAAKVSQKIVSPTCLSFTCLSPGKGKREGKKARGGFCLLFCSH